MMTQHKKKFKPFSIASNKLFFCIEIVKKGIFHVPISLNFNQRCGQEKALLLSYRYRYLPTYLRCRSQSARMHKYLQYLSLFNIIVKKIIWMRNVGKILSILVDKFFSRFFVSLFGSLRLNRVPDLIFYVKVNFVTVPIGTVTYLLTTLGGTVSYLMK